MLVMFGYNDNNRIILVEPRLSEFNYRGRKNCREFSETFYLVAKSALFCRDEAVIMKRLSWHVLRLIFEAK